jgi:hypothetical protein
VLKVLRGEIDLEKYDSCWLLTELAKPTYDIRRRRLVVGRMSHSGQEHAAKHVPEMFVKD